MPNKGIIMLNGRQYGDTGTNYNVVKCTKQEYDAMTPEQRNNGCLYIVVDSAGNSVNYLSAQVAGTKTDDTLTNLLNPTLQTTSTSGLTVTNNGNGTYTINGTSTSQPELYLGSISGLSGKHRLVGCPSGGAQSTFNLSYRIDRVWSSRYEIGNGLEIDCDPTKTYQIAIVVRANQALPSDGITFKPMLTTDLQATYDDFVGYTGGTGRLNSDVAEHEKEISRINADLSESWKLLGSTSSSSYTTINFADISAYREVAIVLVNSTRILATTRFDKSLYSMGAVSYFESASNNVAGLVTDLTNTSAKIQRHVDVGYPNVEVRLYAVK